MKPEYEVPLAQMRESIKTIPAYTSTMWQVVAISMALVTLLVNALVIGIFGEQPIFGTIPGLLLNLLTIGFVWVTQMTLRWFDSVLTRSNLVIFRAWERLAEFSVPLGLVSDISRIPSDQLLPAINEAVGEHPLTMSTRREILEIMASFPHPNKRIRVFFMILFWSLVALALTQGALMATELMFST